MSESETFSKGYKLVFDTAVRVAGEHFSVASSDPKIGSIQCKSSASIWSWGETIEIRVRQIQDDKTQVTAESSASAQLFDWGKSKDNIEKFLSALKAALTKG